MKRGVVEEMGIVGKRVGVERGWMGEGLDWREGLEGRECQEWREGLEGREDWSEITSAK